MKREPMRPITDEERGIFERDGVVLLKGLFDPAWLEFLADGFETAIADMGPFGRDYVGGAGGGGAFYMDIGVWKRHAAFRALATESPLPAVAAAIMGSDRVHLYDDQLFVKEPGTAHPTPFHQDWAFFHFDGWQICGFWLTLDRVGAQDSGLGYVRGSHKWDGPFRPVPIGGARSADLYGSDPATAAGLKTMPDIDGDPAAYDLIFFDYEPGDCSVHHIRTIHGAKGNASQRTRRRAVTVRYCGDDATYLHRPYAPDQGHGLDLRDGDPIGGPDYPLVWPRSQRP